MKYKRILALLLAAITILSLTACNNNNDNDKETNVPTSKNDNDVNINPNDKLETPDTTTPSDSTDNKVTITIPGVEGEFEIELPPGLTTEKKEEEEEEEELPIDKNPNIKHDMAYYLSLPNCDRTENLAYSGQVKLHTTTYKTAPTFKELMYQHTEMETVKDRIVDANTTIIIAFDLLDENTHLYLGNRTNTPKRREELSIVKILFKVDESTKLNQLIGEQLKAVDPSMTFIDSVIDILGYPPVANKIDESTVELRYTYETVTVLLTYNINTNTGEFSLEY